MILSSLSRYRDFGLLILRVGLGVMFVIHGYPKLMGGVPMWEQIGGAMANLGVTFFPVFWGFMAALAEAGGGVCLILGLATRPAAIFMAFTMAVAATHHFKAGDGMAGASHALELAIVFAALVLIGPGRYSLDRD